MDGSSGISSVQAAAQQDNSEAANSSSLAGSLPLPLILLFFSWNLGCSVQIFCIFEFHLFKFELNLS